MAFPTPTAVRVTYHRETSEKVHQTMFMVSDVRDGAPVMFGTIPSIHQWLLANGYNEWSPIDGGLWLKH